MHVHNVSLILNLWVCIEFPYSSEFDMNHTVKECLNYNVAEADVLCPFVQALLHASVACNRKLVVDWVPAENLEDDTSKEVDISFHFSASHLTVLFYFMPNL